MFFVECSCVLEAVLFRDIYCPPEDCYTTGYSIGWFWQGPVVRFTKRCGVTSPSTELTCVPVYWGLQARQQAYTLTRGGGGCHS